jgi:protein-S-isoprenylcysteine O-methyltransferase Ste14
MNTSMRSILFVFVQFLSLILIGLTGPILAESGILLGVELFGLFLGIWAVVSMRMGNFGVTPEPLQGSKMVSRGPYRLIRHPMYLALLVTTLPLVISYYSPLRLGIWLVLLVNLLLKMRHEETLLSDRFPEYGDYISRTSRILPGLF